MDKNYRNSDDFKDSTGFPRIIVGIILYNSKGDLFLATGNKYKGKWSIVGGHVELGETLVEAVRHEVKEETNFDVKDIEFVLFIESIGSDEFTMKKHFLFMDYSALVTNPDDVKLNDEFTEYKWMKPEDALKNLNLNTSTKTAIKKFLEKR